ncbi:MAG: DUF6868 family protein [Spirochaetota bacterium]
MGNISQITSFLGWCSVINIAMLSVASLMVLAFREGITNFHSKISGIPQPDLARLYLQLLGIYKLGTFLFNIVPYIALQVIA